MHIILSEQNSSPRSIMKSHQKPECAFISTVAAIQGQADLGRERQREALYVRVEQT
jgi:hypothetical protein